MSIVKKEEFARRLAQETGFYIKNMVTVVDAIPTVLLDILQEATFEENSELQLMPGLIIGGRRVPSHESINPQDRSTVITPEKVIPYAEFKPSIRQKLYVKPKSYKKTKKKG